MEKAKECKVEIVTGQYQAAPAGQKEMIRQLFGENAEHKYEIYFHWYNLIHELGHVVMMCNAVSRPHPAEEEQLVNNFATAYWRLFGESDKMNELCALVGHTIPKFTVPAQETDTYMDYARKKWGQDELNSFNNYGWFQFSSVQNAISVNQSLEQVIYQMTSRHLPFGKRELFTYDVDERMAFRVIEDAVKVLTDCGIIFPQDLKVVMCDDLNCHMCRVLSCQLLGTK